MLSSDVMRLIPIIAVAFACTEPRAAVPAPREAAGGREGILLSINTGEEGIGLDPVALITRDGLRNVWDIEDDSVFVRRYYAPGMRYAVRVDGVPAGEAAVVRAHEPACTDRLASARVTLTRTLPAEWKGLASDVFGDAPAQPPLHAVTEAERSVLAVLLDRVHAARGAQPGRRREAEIDALYAVTVDGVAAPVLVGTSSIRFANGALEQVQSAMVVAERREGAYRPVYVWYEDQEEGDMQRRTLRDVLDMDGDGVPELVARTTYYESWDYTVLRRGAGGWTEIYQGGGGGC